MIPTLNEEEAIGDLIDEASPVFPSILIVDGGSADRTRQIAEEKGAKVVDQRYGKGKGYGVRTGFEEFLSDGADCLGMIDGDGTNDPKGLLPLLDAVVFGNLDIALGSRTRGRRDPGAMDWFTLASNRTVSFLLGARFLRFFTDIQTGYWVFSRHAVSTLQPQLQSTKFEIELELFTKTMQNDLRLAEFPVPFRKRVGHTKFSFGLRMRNLAYAFRYLL